MPIAYNPWLEANQREGKVSVKQSQALSRSLSSPPLGTRCLSFIPFFFRSNLPFLSSVALSAFGSYMSPSCGVEMGPRPSPGGRSRREIPRTTGLVTDNPKQAAIPILPLYFPGKHLLSSLAQKLASNLPPHSCLVMPIRVYTALCSRYRERRR